MAEWSERVPVREVTGSTSGVASEKFSRGSGSSRSSTTEIAHTILRIVVLESLFVVIKTRTIFDGPTCEWASALVCSIPSLGIRRKRVKPIFFLSSNPFLFQFCFFFNFNPMRFRTRVLCLSELLTRPTSIFIK